MKTLSPGTLAMMSLLSIEGSNVKITQQLDRKQYEAINKVLEACGGKWNRTAKAHVFSEDPTDVLDTVMLTGEVANKKKDLDQFDSPQDVIDIILDRAGIEDMMDAPETLEPSAGVGMLATAAAERGAVVTCIELDPKRCDVLRENPTVHKVIQEDFLNVEPIREYSLIVMNPPFSRQQDIDHVMHAVKFLDHGGTIVAVMSAGVMFRENRKAVQFREAVIGWGGTFEKLPEKAFASSGTNVNTVLLKMTL